MRFGAALAVLLIGIGPAAAAPRDDAGARAAFRAATPVFAHPRCANCHATGDQPRQGEERRPHDLGVVRGPTGHGGGATRCQNCHGETNAAWDGGAPGAPDWHMPPADAPMVFGGRPPGPLCRQLKDRARNGGRSLEDLLTHLRFDPLVEWAWTPGGRRTPPPGSHAGFVQTLTAWVEKGAACPR